MSSRRTLTPDQCLQIPVTGAHQISRYRHVGDQTLNRQSPPARLPQIVLVSVEAAKAQRDGGALASERALHPRLLQGVCVYVQIRRSVEFVVMLIDLGQFHELQLRLGRARTACTAPGVSPPRPHASTADDVSQSNRLGLGRAVVLLVQAQTFLGQPHLVVRVLFGCHIEDLLENGAATALDVFHGAPMLRLYHLENWSRIGKHLDRENCSRFTLRNPNSPCIRFLSTVKTISHSHSDLSFPLALFNFNVSRCARKARNVI